MSDRILSLCRQAVQPGDKIVAAVSGGADSMCLAHAFREVCAQVSAQMFVAHVNHQLRGEAAEADARFVCGWAAEAGLPRVLIRVDVPNKGGESFQNSAREERYRALSQACRRFGANKLATAHHADDQVETFLLNLIRGSGSKGLLGIPRERSLEAGITVIRPLLDVPRTDIEAYCRSHNLAWRTDASNSSLYYQRNRIRHHLLPILREYNPGIDRVLLNTINNLRKDQDVLTDLVQDALKDAEVSSPLPFAPRALSIQILNHLAPALKNRVLLELLPDGAENRHLNAVLKLIVADTGASVDLPGRFRAYRLHDCIAIGAPPHDMHVPEIRVPVPGQVRKGDIVLRADLNEFPGSRQFWLPEAVGDIDFGPRKPGDYFYPPGGGKKLKDYMIDRKVPRWLRSTYPVLRASGEIFWVAGLACDSRFVRPEPGKKSVYVKIENTGGISDEKEYWRNPVGSKGNSGESY